MKFLYMNSNLVKTKYKYKYQVTKLFGGGVGQLLLNQIQSVKLKKVTIDTTNIHLKFGIILQETFLKKSVYEIIQK